VCLSLRFSFNGTNGSTADIITKNMISIQMNKKLNRVSLHLVYSKQHLQSIFAVRNFTVWAAGTLQENKINFLSKVHQIQINGECHYSFVAGL
jgi:hypothetical protein